MFYTPSRVSALCLLLSAAVIPGCAPKHPESLNEGPIVFPLPPDTPRVQFLTQISSSRDVIGEQKSFWRSLIGEEEEEESRPIVKPYGVAIHNGKIYVCDTILGAVEVIDLNERSFDYLNPPGLGQLKKPINCFVDKSDGWLYVADVERRQIVVFDTAGNYVLSFGERERIRPTDVFVDERHIWVSDIDNRKIQVYDKSSHRLVATYPDAQGDAAGALYTPTNLYVTKDRLYVTDFGDFKIKVYSLDGEYLRSVGSYGRALGQFVRPKGIAVDRQENLFVVDAAFQNVQVFNREGKLLMFFGGGYRGPGYMWLPAKVVIDYDNLSNFHEYVHRDFDLRFLILVTNQYGPAKVSVYGFVEPKTISVDRR